MLPLQTHPWPERSIRRVYLVQLAIFMVFAVILNLLVVKPRRSRAALCAHGWRASSSGKWASGLLRLKALRGGISKHAARLSPRPGSGRAALAGPSLMLSGRVCEQLESGRALLNEAPTDRGEIDKRLKPRDRDRRQLLNTKGGGT